MYYWTILDNSVTVTYSGTGSNATFVFNIDTSLSFTTKNLNLGCMISAISTIVYSYNTIAFTVVSCTYTNKISSPSEYKFTLNQNEGSISY